MRTGWALPFAATLARAAILPTILFVSGCAGNRPDPAYDAQRSLAEVVALLQNGIDQDLYRFEPPSDPTGENLFRASLARLERYGELVADPGFLVSMRFARARAHERLLDFETATRLYATLTLDDSMLKERAGEYLPFARSMAEIMRVPEPDAENSRPDQLLLRLADQRQALREVGQDLGEDPRTCLVNLCIERLDVREREYLWRTRALFPNGSRVALDAARELIEDHVESRRVLEHSLRLADMYAELARSYAAAVDPEGYDFDAAYARNLIQSASQIYAEVAAVDGRIEREEARAGLVSLEALTERIGGSR